MKKQNHQKIPRSILKYFSIHFLLMFVGLEIGENGHIAFNDPAVADFNDPPWRNPSTRPTGGTNWLRPCLGTR